MAGRWRGRLLVLGLRQPLFMRCPIISGQAARHSAASQKEAQARNVSPARFKRGPFSRQRNAPRRGTMRSRLRTSLFMRSISAEWMIRPSKTRYYSGVFLGHGGRSCAGKCPRYRLVTSMVRTQKFSNLKSKIYCRKLGLIASYERIFWNA